MGYEQLIVDVEGDVAIVRMNNAARLNALSPTMTLEMLEALEKLRAEEAIRATAGAWVGQLDCDELERDLNERRHRQREPN